MTYNTDFKPLFHSYGVHFKGLLEPIKFEAINDMLPRKEIPNKMWQHLKPMMPFNTSGPIRLEEAAKMVNTVNRAIWECARKSAWMQTVTDMKARAHNYTQFVRGIMYYT